MCHVCRCVCRFCLVCCFMKTFCGSIKKSAKQNRWYSGLPGWSLPPLPPVGLKLQQLCEFIDWVFGGYFADSYTEAFLRSWGIVRGIQRDPLTFWEAERCVSCHDSRKFPRLYTRPHSERLHLTPIPLLSRVQSPHHDRNEHISFYSAKLSEFN